MRSPADNRVVPGTGVETQLDDAGAGQMGDGCGEVAGQVSQLGVVADHRYMGELVVQVGHQVQQAARAAFVEAIVGAYPIGLQAGRFGQDVRRREGSQRGAGNDPLQRYVLVTHATRQPGKLSFAARVDGPGPVG